MSDWLASFIAFKLPEWCLRRLVGRVIAVDEEPAQGTLCQPEFCEDPQFYEGDEYALHKVPEAVDRLLTERGLKVVSFETGGDHYASDIDGDELWAWTPN